MNIFVQPLDGSALVGEPRKLTSETRATSAIFLKGPDVVLYQKRLRRRRELPRPGGGRQDRQGHRPDALRQRARQHHRRPGGRSDHVLVTHNQRDPQVFDVYRVNARRRRAGGAQSRQHRRLADRPCRQVARRRRQRRPEHHPALPRRRGRRISAADHHRLPHQRPSGLLHLRRQEALRPIQPRPRQAGAGCHRPGQARCRGRNLRTAGSRPGRGRLLAQTPRADPGRLPDRQAAVQVLRRPDRNAVQEADGQAARLRLWPCRVEPR